MTREGRTTRSQRLAVLVIVGLAAVALSALAVEIVGDAAVGALLGALVVVAAVGLFQQRRYARRSAADLAAVSRALAATDRRVAAMAKKAAQSETALSREVTQLSRTMAHWSQEAREAEIETGIAALNRYVALGSDHTAHQA